MPPQEVAKVSIQIAKHGLFQCTADSFDIMIAKYLPASPDQLHKVIAEKTQYEPSPYNDVLSVTELLLILAELDGYGL